MTKRERKSKSRTNKTSTAMPPTLRRIAPAAYLIVLSGPDVGAMFKIEPEADLVVGRDGDAPIRLTDEGASRRHARIAMRGVKVVIEDLGSHNGTFVGEERIQRRFLEPDDVIRLGANTVMKFHVTDTMEEEYQRRMLAAAIRDPLTGAHSRRFFQERLVAECSSARRYGHALSLLLIDVDSFKGINDQHGHLAGDAVLKTIAQAILGELRKEDSLIRYGGDEFLVQSRGTDLAGAEVLAERLRAKVEQTPFAPGGGVDPIGATVSIGVTQFQPPSTEQEFFEKADAALYLAKGGGRNRVVALK